jgi:Zn-dependent M28 family amino/carboxypeptidase
MTPALKFSKPGSVSSEIQIDPDYLRGVVQRLAFPRPVDSPDNDTARKIIVEEFSTFLTPTVIGELNNVCAGDPATAKILVGAHYDSVPGTPGADDNASAVAVMLAVARAVGNRHDIVYVAFNSEEFGLAGSREFAESLGQKKLEAVYILEMVGYRDRRANSQENPLPLVQGVPTTGDFLGVVTNNDDLLDNILSGASDCNVPFVGLAVPASAESITAIASYSPHLLRSDHTSFWERGIPAAMLTDTAEFRNPNYHGATDTPDTLDYDFMAEIAKAVVGMIRGRTTSGTPEA